MKKVLKQLAFAGLIVMAGASMAHAAANPCILINEMQGVFKVLRTLAFVGAAFVMAGWAWGWITAGDVKRDDVKDRGVALIVGFTVLFGIGMILQFLGPITGCVIAGW